jgi:hypothetical protein
VKPRYIIVWSYDISALIQLVNERYEIGYHAVGGVTTKGNIWAQAMVLA